VCTNFVQLVKGHTQIRGKDRERIPMESSTDEVKGRSLKKLASGTG
jgi:hypothetical protein